MWHESKPNETEKGNRRLRDVVAFITRRSDVQIGFRVISTGLTAPHFPFPTRFSAFSYTNFHAQRKISIQNLFLAYKTGSIFFKALIELNEDVHFFAERCILRDDQIRVIFPLYTSSFFFFWFVRQSKCRLRVLEFRPRIESFVAVDFSLTFPGYFGHLFRTACRHLFSFLRALGLGLASGGLWFFGFWLGGCDADRLFALLFIRTTASWGSWGTAVIHCVSGGNKG